MKTTILLLSILPFTLFAQEFEKERKIHFGATTHFVTSSLRLNGFNLMPFVEFKKHQIAFGPRYTFSPRIYIPNSNTIYSKKSNSTTLDFHYRYYLLERSKRFNTFAQFSAEMNFRKFESTFFYDPNTSTPEIDPSQGNAGPYFENSFNGRTEAFGSYWGFYVGIGEEMKITKGLFATVNIGFGNITGNSQYEITDTDKNEKVYSLNNKSFWNSKIAMTGSAGIGYRF